MVYRPAYLPKWIRRVSHPAWRTADPIWIHNYTRASTERLFHALEYVHDDRKPTRWCHCLGKEAEVPAPPSALVLGREARISDVNRVNRRRKMGTMYVLHILNPCMVDVVRCIKVESEGNFRSWYHTANHTKTSNPICMELRNDIYRIPQGSIELSLTGKLALPTPYISYFTILGCFV